MVDDLIEKVAKAICEASGEEWRTGTYPIHSGPRFEIETHSLDPFNNHWRCKAKAAVKVMQAELAQTRRKALEEALTYCAPTRHGPYEGIRALIEKEAG